MPEHCPACGAAVAYASENGPVATGTCAACGSEFTVISGVSARLPAADADSDEETDGEAAVGVPCDVCGETVAVALADDRSLRTHCPGCGKDVTYRSGPADGPRPRYDDRPRRDRF